MTVLISNDVLGNRDSDPSGASYGWDQVNRLTTCTSGSTTTSYSYRADGMRVQKSDSGGGSTSYAYDGQMGFEDSEVGGSNPGVTDYAIGARGIDRIAFTNGSTTTIAYPILDGHGNMAATLSESGSSYSTNNSRSFDAWGNVLNGSSSGDPKGRYCANLGHKQDDESGLIYMRARYEDPVTGRFVSEDPSHNGANWTVYCANYPTSFCDRSGRDIAWVFWYIAMGAACIIAGELWDEGNYLGAWTAIALACGLAEEGLDSQGKLGNPLKDMMKVPAYAIAVAGVASLAGLLSDDIFTMIMAGSVCAYETLLVVACYEAATT